MASRISTKILNSRVDKKYPLPNRRASFINKKRVQINNRKKLNILEKSKRKVNVN
jgi:hypothetical protein